MADEPSATDRPYTVSNRQVIPVQGPVQHWVEPWYLSYAILGALASGLAVILIPVVVDGSGGTATQVGAAIAAQNVGALFAPLWGWIADRSRAYRGIFFGGFVLLALGFLGFTLVHGMSAWLLSAFLVGFGTGASNTVACLFVVEFTAKSEWSERISWLQTFNALGSVVGMAVAGLLEPRLGTLLSALLVIPAIMVGGWGLPVPGGPLHFPQLHFRGADLAHMLRRGGPNSISALAHLHRLRRSDIAALGTAFSSAFGTFLVGWFFFSLAISAFSSFYPVLMTKSFEITVTTSSMLMSVATAISIPLYNLAGKLATRYRPDQVLTIGIGGRIVALAGLAIVAYTQPSFAFVPVLLLYGLFQGIWPLLGVASNDLAADLAPFGEGTAMGLFNAAAAIASALGAVVGGAVADVFGFASVIVFGAVGASIALLCMLSRRLSQAVVH
jgi:DHA1 family tetracycline resistance protein-like MFS transporter